MTPTDNERGYAFTALDRAWERMFEWDWFAAMNRAGMLPTKQEYLADGLRMFDALVLEMDYNAATQATVQALRKSIRSDANGRLTWEKQDDGKQRISVKYAPIDVQEMFDHGLLERGYHAVEVADATTRLLRRLKRELPAGQWRLIEVYAGLGDPTNAELADVLGVKRETVVSAWRRVRDSLTQLNITYDGVVNI